MTTQQSSQEGPSQPIDLGLNSVFDYEELMKATDSFNPAEVLGQGGFGVVYQGKLRDERAVAIKELVVHHDKLVKQFLNEVKLFSGLRHENIVTLFGRTNPKYGKMLLVSEFVPNGTVAEHLHHKKFPEKALAWSQRLQIAIQTAEGLSYLHLLQPPVIHCDVKTDNILLDNSFNAKVADFGLSRLLPPSGTHISTMPQGTQGYLDPDYKQHYKLTTKSDVYCFGVVLMELISGQAVLDYEERDDDEVWLVHMAFNKMKNNQLEQLVDRELDYSGDSKISRMVNSVAQLACKCLHPTGFQRPDMVEVLESLKKISDDGSSTSQVSKDSQEESSEPIDLGLSWIFDYEELQEATKFFNRSEVVGEGGFGAVYRGTLRDGRAVAIKELIFRPKKRIEQFFNEASFLSRLRHKNVVAFYGCTYPKDERTLLVYEFVPNGTVADHLHHRRFSKKTFTWSQRLQIAIETAEGLAYLHSLQPPVIHRGVKTDNILLDSSFSVKIADFGMSRLLPSSRTHFSSMPHGTQGYLDPEYNQLYKLTTKSDVYSFGVVLIELISGKAVLNYEERDDDEVWLVRLALNKMKNDQLDQLVDQELGYLEDRNIFYTVKSVAQLAYECLQPRGYERPSMMEVFKSLKKISDDGSFTSQEGPSEPIDLSLSSIFNYDELLEATNSFDPLEIVGKDGFGVIYRGKLRDGRVVAIKELSVCHEKSIQFLDKVWFLSQLHHKNLVRFYGCTNPEVGKIHLVYEFVPNGTVADHLHRVQFSEKVFTWSQRLQIAVETAGGLAYLHSLQTPVIHFGVKTNNILLDNNFNVKVADFALSGILPSSGANISAMQQRPAGYLDPEYKLLNKLTTKSDVYCFGVVLMELLSRKAVVDFERDGSEMWLVNMALNKMKNGQLDQLVDPKLGYSEDTKIFRTVNSVADLAYDCLQPRGHLRPSMMEVFKSLKEMNDDNATTSPGGVAEIQLVNMASQQGSSEPTILVGNSIFNYDELAEATNFFNTEEVVGRGGFGVVYRGNLRASLAAC